MSGTRKDIFFSFAQRYAGFVIALASSAVLSRILTPEETGLYSIAAALINIAQILRNFGAFAYILQEKNLTREKIGSAVGVSLIVAVVLTILLVVSARSISAFYNNPALAPLIFILSANFVIAAYSAVGYGLLMRNMGFRQNMVITIAGAITNSGGSIILALLGYGAAGLAWAALANALVSLVGYIVVFGKDVIIRPNFLHWREVFHFGVFSSAAGLLEEVSNRTPDLLIGRLVSLEGAGLFSRGAGLVNSLTLLTTGAIQPVAASLFAKTYRDGAGLKQSYLEAISYVCIVAWPAFALLAVLAHPIIAVMFGSQWTRSAPVTQILCLGAALALVGVFAQTLLRSTGAVQRNLLIQAIAVPTYVTGVAVGGTLGLTAAAVGSVVSGAVISIVSALVLHRRVQIGATHLLQSLRTPLVVTLAVAGAAQLVVAIGGQSPKSLLYAIPLAGVAWFGGVLLLRHPIRHELRMLRLFVIQKVSDRLNAISN